MVKKNLSGFSTIVLSTIVLWQWNSLKKKIEIISRRLIFWLLIAHMQCLEIEWQFHCMHTFHCVRNGLPICEIEEITNFVNIFKSKNLVVPQHCQLFQVHKHTSHHMLVVMFFPQHPNFFMFIEKSSLCIYIHSLNTIHSFPISISFVTKFKF